MTDRRRQRALVVVGDALLDRDIVGDVSRISPDAPVPVVLVRDEHVRPGGAALTALLAARLHDGPVRLLTSLGSGSAAIELRGLMSEAGVAVVDLGGRRSLAEKVRVRAAGQSLLRLDREGQALTGVSAPVAAIDGELLDASLVDAGTVVVSDYGRGLTHDDLVRSVLAALAAAVPVVWDPHRNGGIPVARCRLVTPNETEAAWLSGEATDSGAGGDARPKSHDGTETMAAEAPVVAATRRAAALVQRWGVHAVTVTLGGRGAVMVDRHGMQVAAPGLAAVAGDACGAGDCFAAAAGAALARGDLPSEAVTWAVEQAGRYVAAGGPVSIGARSAAGHSSQSADGTGRQLGAVGATSAAETVVATSGCFDLLHAGHVQMLTAARRLGDRLVVLLNSDAGVRRLKGPERPLQSQADRVAVLQSLSCVDEVVVFDEDTPVAALERLRPQLFVKGGDYHAADLPEAAALVAWGGQTVTVPYLPDRSTTRLVEEAARHAH